MHESSNTHEKCGSANLVTILIESRASRTMTPLRNTSKLRSAASSSAKRLESAVFHLDESIYTRVLCEALEWAGGTAAVTRTDSVMA